MNRDRELAQLQAIDRELTLLEQNSALLEWDEETQMPSEALEGRSDQISLIQGYIYDKKTSSLMGELLDALEEDGVQCTDVQRAIVRTYRREYDRTVKIPRQLVLDLSHAASTGQAAWTGAREQSDFSLFSSHLEHMIGLKRDYAEAMGYGEHLYDALIDEYEPGMSSSMVSAVFDPLKVSVSELLSAVAAQPQIDDSFLYRDYPRDLQDSFGRMILRDMGFDFSRAQMAEAVHPFTTTVGYDDIRITTRYDEPMVSSPLFSTIHEGGHALYELGASNSTTRGTVLAQGVSMAVHESQSRLWENVIARSEEFWHHYYPRMQDLFPEQLSDVTEQAFVRGINKVEPSMIRVNADEVSYSLHIILRFELEKALISGDLTVTDLPAAWNDMMKELLGIVPATDAEGVLQDVHWSAGLFGYFPTYALGNLFGSQFYRTMELSIPDLGRQITAGNLRAASSWLNEHIYRHGSIYPSLELLSRVTGEQLDPQYFIDYLNRKYAAIYHLD